MISILAIRFLDEEISNTLNVGLPPEVIFI